jgi:hypothetical protein
MFYHSQHLENKVKLKFGLKRDFNRPKSARFQAPVFDLLLFAYLLKHTVTNPPPSPPLMFPLLLPVFIKHYDTK